MKRPHRAVVLGWSISGLWQSHVPLARSSTISWYSAPAQTAASKPNVDVCVSGCLEYGDDFAREFIATTFLWAPHWLNERTLARRPWLHQRQYIQIDRLLKELVPQYYEQRRLESEYATLMSTGELL